MIKKFTKFINNQNKNINEIHYMGIDFEFNKISKTIRYVALMQINLENNKKKSYIFLLCPPKLKKGNETLIKLLTNPNIFKILHGCESLDIPYLFNQLLITLENINNFCKNFFDTKFICEYKNSENIENLKKCSIYDVLLNDEIISQEQLDNLNKIDEDMGPIYLIDIDVNKLDNVLTDYALYDVLFLPELLKKNISQINENSHLIISDILKIIFLYKRNLDDTFLKLESLINSINNNFFFESKQRYILNNVWSDYYDLITNTDYVISLININYFKSFFKIISKYILYKNIYKNFIIYKAVNKQTIINEFNFFDWLKEYIYLYPIILNMDKIIINDIKNWNL